MGDYDFREDDDLSSTITHLAKDSSVNGPQSVSDLIGVDIDLRSDDELDSTVPHFSNDLLADGSSSSALEIDGSVVKTQCDTKPVYNFRGHDDDDDEETYVKQPDQPNSASLKKTNKEKKKELKKNASKNTNITMENNLLQINLSDSNHRISIDGSNNINILTGRNNQVFVKTPGGNISIVQSKAGDSMTEKSAVKKNEKTTITIPMGVVSPSAALNVTRCVAPQWKQLGRWLGMTDTELETIRYDHHIDGVQEVCYKMLLSWMEKYSSEATYKKLGQALLKIEKPEVVKKLREFKENK